MSDDYTGDESGNWTDDGGSSSKSSMPCCSCCCGLLLFPLMLYLLGWNENNFVCTNKKILYTDQNAKPMGCDSSQAVPGMAYVTCPVRTSSYRTFTPADFNPNLASDVLPISFAGVQASQLVEMYQCQEKKTDRTEKQNGQSRTVTEYKYQMVWSSEALQLTPAKLAVARQFCPDLATATANPMFPLNVAAGRKDGSSDILKIGASDTNAYTVPQSFYSTGLTMSPVPLSTFAGKFLGQAPMTGIWAPPPTVLSTSSLKVGSSGTHLETCPGQSRLGCVRISYQVAKPVAASVLADVIPSTHFFAPAKTPPSWGCAAGSFYDFREGSVPKDVMIDDLKSTNNMLVWVFRIVGVLGAWCAVYCILSPVSACADKIGDVFGMIPCCGDFIEGLIEGVVEMILCTISCSVGFSCSFLVISLVWLYMRPLYGAFFLLVSVCCFGVACTSASHVAQHRRGAGNSNIKDFE